MANLLWLQGGASSGDTMSFLNAEEPSACDLVTDFGINVLWRPSLGLELGASAPANIASQPKCSPASSGDLATTGTLRPRPIAAAMWRSGAPSSAIA